jgi:hypothetical protein
MTWRLQTKRKPSEEYVESTEESRETIREYVEQALADGREPSAHGFKAEHDTPGTRWDHDAVDAEIERMLLTEAIALRNDIRNYVKAGGWDAFSFSALAYPRYKHVAGNVIQRMINTERERLDGGIS